MALKIKLFFKINYPKNRKQYTTIFQENESELVENNIGLPQGSHLAPVLFIIYINNMANIVKHCKPQIRIMFILIMFRCMLMTRWYILVVKT